MAEDKDKALEEPLFDTLVVVKVVVQLADDKVLATVEEVLKVLGLGELDDS